MHKSRVGIGQSLDCLCAFTSGHFFCQHCQFKMYAFTLHSSVTQIKTVFPSDFSLGINTLLYKGSLNLSLSLMLSEESPRWGSGPGIEPGSEGGALSYASDDGSKD